MRIVQLLSGVDFARGNEEARAMANFAYLLVDDATRTCAVVDPSWDPAGLLARIDELGLRLVAAIPTHGHADHTGGNLYGARIEGLRELLAARPVKVWANATEAEAIAQRCQLPAGSVEPVQDGEERALGESTLAFLHTPGHSPGAQCIRAGGAVITGDTLFVGECGRIDLPGSDPDAMFHSLRRLADLPEDTVVYPGHHYGPRKHSTIGEERSENPCLQPKTLEEWRRAI